MKSFATASSLLLAAVILLPGGGSAQESGGDSAAALHEKLLKLQTAASLLQVTAHPDDEHGGMLTLMSRGRGVRVALVSLTRGEAGANAIGPELFDALGSVRAQELARAGGYYGLDALYFTRLADYGYSKRLTEAIEKWGKEDAIRDLVFVIRSERPLVVVSRFQGNDRDGHGQHQFAGVVTREAFRAASDPSAFPELGAMGLGPWQPLKLYLGGARETEHWNLALDSGEYDPWLGETYENVARTGLSFQRSQNEGELRRVEGAYRRFYVRLESLVGAPDRETSFFDGIDTSLLGVARIESSSSVSAIETELRSIDNQATSALQSFDPARPGTVVPALARGLELLRRLEGRPESRGISRLLEVKERQFDQALRSALGIRLSAIAEPEGATADTGSGPVVPEPMGAAVPGEELAVRLSISNRGTRSVRLRSARLLVPEEWTVRGVSLPSELSSGESWSGVYDVRLGADSPVISPQIERSSIAESRYRSRGKWFLGAPPPVATAELEVGVDGVSMVASEVVKRWDSELPYGLVARELDVVPALSVSVSPRVAVVPSAARSSALDVLVEVTSYDPGGVNGRVALELPEGFTAEPAFYDLVASAAPQSMRYSFHLAGPSIGTKVVGLGATVVSGAKTYRDAYQPLEHRDLETSYRITPARIRLVGLDVTLPSELTVAYVMGVGDEVPDAIRALGARLDLLSSEDLARRDLSSYDAVVLGTRAYAVREDLVTYNRRLLDYVEGGGHLVVLYNTPEFHPRGLAPYGAELPPDAEEVTEEDAPVEILAPDHPLLNWPNRIAAGDFEGWVEQRGSKFWSQWDEHYVPLVQCHDRGQAPQKGGWLTARYGKGYYTYFAYALHRQLPFGVPGAYRILANLISLSRFPGRRVLKKSNGTLRERSEPGREEWAPRSRQPRESGRPPRARSAGSEPSEERGEHY